ncbi:hypothetical protein CN325_00745 [Bacillus thuringiensis]|uniref:Uncharacterized protein n=1 Tax=Bacillus thuringiensis TaxID=1428 RepID=A0AB36TLB8_BACTU|nr:hypothetical protein COM74_28855 [Bacillus thuringiensis]PEE86081.1 hypothetical protein COM90_25200 [Bacillus thuringiensis]PEV85262.1 hypothetical protein CN442_28955 [Bacillus thuringiensis]PFF02202.1 hypothetical protein CN325_00745 [Bacillus thuringiensis]PFK84953.1 hypothetical protein COJ04_25890 [Bacillus thuringiensis]
MRTNKFCLGTKCIFLIIRKNSATKFLLIILVGIKYFFGLIFLILPHVYMFLRERNTFIFITIYCLIKMVT